jgi:hypothetical protein
MKAKAVNESVEQAWLARWLDIKCICWCHVPNGGARNMITGARLKREGVKKGVPDILIFDPPRRAQGVGVAIELKKAKGGTVSPEQVGWLAALNARGWITYVAHGADDAIRMLTDLGY